jgi:hypothetical protein
VRLPSEFKASDHSAVRIGGEASTRAIRQTLGMYSHLRELVPLGLMEISSYHARGCERDQQDEEYVVSSALGTTENVPFP